VFAFPAPPNALPLEGPPGVLPGAAPPNAVLVVVFPSKFCEETVTKSWSGPEGWRALIAILIGCTVEPVPKLLDGIESSRNGRQR
jgi:hypothetical protein